MKYKVEYVAVRGVSGLESSIAKHDLEHSQAGDGRTLIDYPGFPCVRIVDIDPSVRYQTVLFRWPGDVGVSEEPVRHLVDGAAIAQYCEPFQETA